MNSLSYAKLLLDANIKAVARPQGRKLRRRERALRREVKTQFEEQKKYILKEIKKIWPTKTIENDIDDLLNNIDDEEMILIIIDESKKVMKMGGNYRIRKLRLSELGIYFDIQHPLAIQYLESTRPLVLAKMKQTTKDEIKPILIEAVRTGQSYNETAGIISEANAFSLARSQMIATNEIGHAYEYGNYIVMQQVEDEGYKSIKAWATVRDNRVTPECAANENQGWIGFKENFLSGDDSAPRDNHPRCRCTTLYDYE